MNGLWLCLRLFAATVVVLSPGWAIARALGARGLSAALAWGLTALFAAMAVTFAVNGSIVVTLVLLLIAGLVALPAALQRHESPPPPGWVGAGIAGLAFGVLLWHVAGHVGGDGFFHLARVRKLLAFDDLSLGSLNEFPDGSLHPGYAFPLWHGFLALVAKVSFADPSEVVVHESSILAPIAVVVAFEAGWVLFRRVVPAALSAAASVALVAMAPGHGGAYTALALPATASRQILVPAALALALLAVHAPARTALATAAAGAFVLAVVHPTYALFLILSFAGFVAVRWLWQRVDLRGGALALAALAIPVAAFVAWLTPVVGDTASVSPDAQERARGIAQYAGQLHVRSLHSFSLSAEVFARAGAVAVAALLLVPFAALATRRRWAAFVVGGSLVVLCVTLLPFLFTPFSDAVSLSQSRRFAGFLPFAFSFAGGTGIVAGAIGLVAAPVALAAGILFQVLYPGDFSYGLGGGGPSWVLWIAVAGAVAALAVGFRRHPLEAARATPLAAALAGALFLAPVYLHGLTNWSPSAVRSPNPLTPGLVAALRHSVPQGAIVYSDPESSYRIAAAAPVYICVAPPGHVADTKLNRPRQRVREFRRFARTHDLGIPRGCGATFIVVDRSRFSELHLPVAFRDGRYTLYRVR